MSTISNRPTAVENFLNAAGASIRYAAYWPASKSVDPQVSANAKKELARADRDFMVESQAGLRKTGKAAEAVVKGVDQFVTDADKALTAAGKAIAKEVKLIGKEIEAARTKPTPAWVKEFHEGQIG